MHEIFRWFQFVKKSGPQLRNDLPKLFPPLYNFRVSNELIDRLDVGLANRLDIRVFSAFQARQSLVRWRGSFRALRFNAKTEPTDRPHGAAFEN
jgi:hypothetical protein